MKLKYPRIAHCPWSENVSGDDTLHSDMTLFEGQDVRATIKMDGENTTITRDYIHAQSLEYPHHESRTWMTVLEFYQKRYPRGLSNLW
jgi:hypothetical protein